MRTLSRAVAYLGVLCALAACRAPLPPPRVPLVAAADEPWRTTPPPLTTDDRAVDAPEAYTLSNGLTVVLVRRPTDPLLHTIFVNQRGGLDDLDTPGGLPALTASALAHAWAHDASPADGVFHVDHLGAWIHTYVHPSDGDAHLATLARALRTRDLGDARVQARIAEVAMQREQATGNLAVMEQLLREHTVTRAHPWARDARGTAREVSSVTPASVRAFLSVRYSPEACALVLAGPLDATPRVMASLEAQFGPWPRQGVAPRAVYPAELRDDGPHAVVLLRTATPQTRMVMSLATRELSRDDRAAAAVLNALLGGANGRLNRVVRVERGLSYGLTTSVSTDGGVTALTMLGAVRTERFGQGLRGVLAAMASLRDAAPTDDELARARRTVSQELAEDDAASSSRADVLAREFCRSGDVSAQAAFRAAVERVRGDDVRRVAAVLLAPSRMFLAVEGEPAQLMGVLTAVGFQSVDTFGRGG